MNRSSKEPELRLENTLMSVFGIHFCVHVSDVYTHTSLCDVRSFSTWTLMIERGGGLSPKCCFQTQHLHGGTIGTMVLTCYDDGVLYRVLQKELCNCIPNVTVWRTLLKHLHLKISHTEMYTFS
jgi:hypothetical protein